MLQRFLVGGAIRDELLGLPVADRDWVVVGATPQQMVDAGFKLKDESFQVYLHPESGEEHALARREQSYGQHHRDFVIDTSPDITLEEDLKRRDLTINAIARSEGGAVIDPFNGVQDLRSRVLRHVSAAFPEDALRLLRAARFKARLEPFGFAFARSTFLLLEQIARNADGTTLSPSRVWAETRQALSEPDPSEFFRTLHTCGGDLFSLPGMVAFFQGNDWQRVQKMFEKPATWQHRLLAIHALCNLGGRRHEYSATAYPLNQTDKETCQSSIQMVKVLDAFEQWDQAVPTPGAILQLLEHTDAIRRTERVENIFRILTHVLEISDSPHTQQLNTYKLALVAAKQIDAGHIARAAKGIDVKGAIRNERLDAIELVLAQLQR